MDSYPAPMDIPLPKPILLDGGIGTGLTKYGYDESVPLPVFALQHPDALIELQSEFLSGGAQILRTATHGANSENLKKYGLDSKTEELNIAAAKITYDNFHGKALIAGCLSTTGLYIEPYGDSTFTEIMSVYSNQVKALSPYCDLFSIESVPTLWNMRAAVLACKKENKPIILTMQVDEDGDTDIGTNALCALLVLQEMDVGAFGLSCTSPKIVADIIKTLAPYAKIPLIAKPDAVEYQNDEKRIIPPFELALSVKEAMQNGAELAGGCRFASGEHLRAISDMLSDNDFSVCSDTKKQDTSLAFATENQMFFLDPQTTEFSPAVRCEPDMSDVITEMCSQSYDVLTISINSPDDAIDFGRNMHMATLPTAFLSDNVISLKMALMLYQGRAIIDSNSSIEPQTLEGIAKKYGAVIY